MYIYIYIYIYIYRERYIDIYVDACIYIYAYNVTFPSSFYLFRTSCGATRSSRPPLCCLRVN